jgi:beta-glucosidase
VAIGTSSLNMKQTANFTLAKETIVEKTTSFALDKVYRFEALI